MCLYRIRGETVACRKAFRLLKRRGRAPNCESGCLEAVGRFLRLGKQATQTQSGCVQHSSGCTSRGVGNTGFQGCLPAVARQGYRAKTIRFAVPRRWLSPGGPPSTAAMEPLPCRLFPYPSGRAPSHLHAARPPKPPWAKAGFWFLGRGNKPGSPRPWDTSLGDAHRRRFARKYLVNPHPYVRIVAPNTDVQQFPKK